MPTQKYPGHLFESEQSFCQLYTLPIRQLDKIHWSPLSVVYKAAQFLAGKGNTKILDIGSGAGKFCLAGAYYNSSAFFYGVEQRQFLVEHAQSALEIMGRLNVEFICKNFTQLNLKDYDAFYFYNSFFENFTSTDKIDDTIAYSPELYHYYSRYLYNGLKEMPAGTRIATYCSWDDEIPSEYRLVRSYNDNLLKCWEKI